MPAPMPQPPTPAQPALPPGLPSPTDSPTDSPATEAALAEFQWLMAGDGHGVDLSRLRTDRAYARGCLALARGSTSPGLQQAADGIGRLLRVTVPMA